MNAILRPAIRWWAMAGPIMPGGLWGGHPLRYKRRVDDRHRGEDGVRPRFTRSYPFKARLRHCLGSRRLPGLLATHSVRLTAV
jgi:hypothetical protein